MKYLLEVETDWDFGFTFKGKSYTGYDEKITLNSVDELDDIKLLGPFGTPPSKGNKTWEFLEGIKAIKANPNEDFSNMGGNRGISWTVLSNYDTTNDNSETNDVDQRVSAMDENELKNAVLEFAGIFNEFIETGDVDTLKGSGLSCLKKWGLGAN